MSSSGFDGWTQADIDAHNAQVAGKPLPPQAPVDAAEREIEEIHYPIMKFCKEHRIPYIRARSDKESGIGKGVNDFTVFYNACCLLIEAKSKDGELSEDQKEWRQLCKEQGFTVHVIYSYNEFLTHLANTYAISKFHPAGNKP